MAAPTIDLTKPITPMDELRVLLSLEQELGVLRGPWSSEMQQAVRQRPYERKRTT